MKNRQTSAARRAAAFLLAFSPLGCEERRVVAVYGPLTGVAGAEGGLTPDAPRRAERKPAESTDDAPRPDENLRLTDPRGVVTLVSRNPRELIFHLRMTLQQEESDLLLDQVLSEATREEYRTRGMDPSEAVAFLRQHRAEIERLLQQIPMGELSPGLFARPLGPSRFRLEIPKGRVDPALRFRRFDYVFERGSCRLLLVS